MDASWQQWVLASGTILTAVGTLWAVYRKTGRTDRRQEYQLSRQSQTDALEQCWTYAKNREDFYESDKKSLLDRIAALDEQVTAGREEIHEIRDQWSAAELKSVRLEEENKYLLRELGIPNPPKPASPPPKAPPPA